jgi:HEPN domain-containing protein
MEKSTRYEEWYFQSDYDLETAFDMFKSGRMVYCIFMCHLCLEKALKGLLLKKTGVYPLKSHNLSYFVEKIGLVLSDTQYEFLYMINKISVPTRYPENLQKLFAEFPKERTELILEQTKEIQQWIKLQ